MELRIQIDFQRAVKQVISQVSSNLSMAETQVSYIRSSKTIHLKGKKQNISNIAIWLVQKIIFSYSITTQPVYEMETHPQDSLGIPMNASLEKKKI